MTLDLQVACLLKINTTNCHRSFIMHLFNNVAFITALLFFLLFALERFKPNRLYANKPHRWNVWWMSINVINMVIAMIVFFSWNHLPASPFLYLNLSDDYSVAFFFTLYSVLFYQLLDSQIQAYKQVPVEKGSPSSS